MEALTSSRTVLPTAEGTIKINYANLNAYKLHKINFIPQLPLWRLEYSLESVPVEHKFYCVLKSACVVLLLRGHQLP